MGRSWIVIGGLSACLAVACGAYGAHGLDRLLDRLEGVAAGEPAQAETPEGGAGPSSPPLARQRKLANWESAARYQMYHALGLVALGLLVERRRSKCLTVAGLSFVAGTILFCGFLYALVLGGPRWTAHVVPFGGVLFMVGWLALACGACCGRSGELVELKKS